MTVTSRDLISLFGAIADAMTAERDRLCELDGVIGDADHGIAMEGGFGAVRDALAALDPETAEPTTVFNTAAKSFLNAVGASSGPLYATALMRAGAAAKGKPQLDDPDFAAAFAAMARGIQERGKAEPGEKTMVDAWVPAAEAMEASMAAGASLKDALAAASHAAALGADSTKAMVASKGRSARLGDRARGHVDPGAASAAIMIEAMRQALEARAPA